MQVQQAATASFPYFTEEHELIRQTVKRFCQEEIAPHAAAWDCVFCSYCSLEGWFWLETERLVELAPPLTEGRPTLLLAATN